jgi:hypothetical protein
MNDSDLSHEEKRYRAYRVARSWSDAWDETPNRYALMPVGSEIDGLNRMKQNGKRDLVLAIGSTIKRSRPHLSLSLNYR